VYAISKFDGVLKITDGGVKLECPEQTPNVIYGAALGREIFRSLDGGASWIAVNSWLTTLFC